jgi:large subunit ribosomal protein L18
MKRKIESAKLRARIGRQRRVARQLALSKEPKLTVFRSAKHIYVQLVDGETGRTITTVSSRSKQLAGDGSARGNVEAAKRVGKAIAEAARERQIERVVFNRNGFLFHGRVKALAEAAREAGLQF